MPVRAAVAPAPRLAAFKSVRMYSAASGLKKEEVEGRIMGILQGFDKVSYTCGISKEEKRIVGYFLLEPSRSRQVIFWLIRKEGVEGTNIALEESIC